MTDKSSWLSLAAGIVLAGATISQAEPYRDCPPSISPGMQTVTKTWHGAPLDREYYLNPKGIWFKLPFGYLNPWPDRDAERLLRQRTPQNPRVPGLGDATGVTFAFWMPSLRGPERDRFSVPSFRPCESGREISHSEFVVEAEVEWPWLPSPEKHGFITPEMRYENGVRYLGLRKEKEEYGLIRLVGSKELGSIFYNTKPEAKMQLNLRCSPDIDEPPNPSCDGNVWWPEEKLGLWVYFSKQDLPKWQEIITATRALAYRWRKNAVAE
jgi:hypothetical protein